MEFTYDKKEEFELIDEGNYEVIIQKVAEKQLPSGARKISFQFKIRDDVEQNFKNRVLFDDVWKNKETGVYNMARINKILRTQEDLEDGHIFTSVDELSSYLTDKRCIVHVIKEFSDYSQKDENKIQYFVPSKIPFGQKLSGDASSNFVEIDEDDLPF